MNNEENNMTLVQKNNNETVITTLEQISKPLEEFVASNDLPTINVLASNEEKAKLLYDYLDYRDDGGEYLFLPAIYFVCDGKVVLDNNDAAASSTMMIASSCF